MTFGDNNAMRRFIGAFFACCALLSAHAFAAEKPNVLVMGEDADEPGREAVVVARDTRVFKQVLETITEELTREGYSVFDERAVTLGNFKQNRTGRGEAELIDIARSVNRPPIDVLVLFTVYAGARELAYTTNVYARITGRIVDTRTGRKLGSVEVASPPGWKAPVDCTADCLVENIGENAKGLASELGAELAQRLSLTMQETKETSTAARSSAYTLVFGGFTPDDLSGVEEYLVAFKGYKVHRPVATSPRGVEYWYEIDTDSARLNRNLRMMLDRLGAEGRISYSSADNTFMVEKKSPAKP